MNAVPVKIKAITTATASYVTSPIVSECRISKTMRIQESGTESENCLPTHLCTIISPMYFTNHR